MNLYIVVEKIGDCNRMSCDGKLGCCDFETGQDTLKTHVKYSGEKELVTAGRDRTL